MPTEPKSDYEQSPGQYWREQLENAKQTFDAWEQKGKKVVKRYRDERESNEHLKKKFNILWSNIQVMFPSLYGRAAKPEVSRRYMDNDPVGRLASTMLERTLSYEVEQFPDYDGAMAAAVQDRLLPGRGTAWVRYEPVISQQAPDESQEAQISDTQEPPVESIDAAHSPVDYVYWQDFIHSPARTWDEVWWVARWVYMTRDEGVERFGDVFKNVSLTSTNADGDSKQTQQAKSTFTQKAKVAEIWNKRTGRVCWVADGYDQALDEREDPLHLESFFPCPKPLFATLTNGSLIPIPDYIEYQDQARELDDITNRIYMLVKAVKAAGTYNAEFKELGRLLSEGIDNTLIPVTNFSALAEKGGIKGAIDLMDISVILQALAQLYVSRESVKQTIYEICGISDILRGASDANETLGAQQLKANFGSLRLKSSQQEVARFASELFQLKSQIICNFYPPDLIVKMSGVDKMPEAQQPDFPQQLQAAMQLLRDSTVRDWSITVESDTLAQIDEQAEKQAATEAITAIATFLQQAMPMVAAAPETLPMCEEILLFLVRRYRAGRGLEGAIERTMQALQQKAAQQAQQAPQNPEAVKAQAQAQSDQARMQADGQIAQMKAQSDAQIAQVRAQADTAMHQQKLQADTQVEQLKMQHEQVLQTAEQRFEAWKAELESRTRITVAEIAAKAAIIPKARPVETVTQ